MQKNRKNRERSVLFRYINIHLDRARTIDRFPMIDHFTWPLFFKPSRIEHKEPPKWHTTSKSWPLMYRSNLTALDLTITIGVPLRCAVDPRWRYVCADGEGSSYSGLLAIMQKMDHARCERIKKNRFHFDHARTLCPLCETVHRFVYVNHCIDAITTEAFVITLISLGVM